MNDTTLRNVLYEMKRLANAQERTADALEKLASVIVTGTTPSGRAVNAAVVASGPLKETA